MTVNREDVFAPPIEQSRFSPWLTWDMPELVPNWVDRQHVD